MATEETIQLIAERVKVRRAWESKNKLMQDLESYTTDLRESGLTPQTDVEAVLFEYVKDIVSMVERHSREIDRICRD